MNYYPLLGGHAGCPHVICVCPEFSCPMGGLSIGSRGPWGWFPNPAREWPRHQGPVWAPLAREECGPSRLGAGCGPSLAFPHTAGDHLALPLLSRTAPKRVTLCLGPQPAGLGTEGPVPAEDVAWALCSSGRSLPLLPPGGYSRGSRRAPGGSGHFPVVPTFFRGACGGPLKAKEQFSSAGLPFLVSKTFSLGLERLSPFRERPLLSINLFCLLIWPCTWPVQPVGAPQGLEARAPETVSGSFALTEGLCSAFSAPEVPQWSLGP